MAAAKRNLERGDDLDGSGGYTVYGTIESADRADEYDYVPFELLHGATVRAPVEQDTVLTYDDVELVDSSIKRLRENPDSFDL